MKNEDSLASLEILGKNPEHFTFDEFGQPRCEMYVADDDMTNKALLAAGYKKRHPLHFGGGNWKKGVAVSNTARRTICGRIVQRQRQRL